MSAVAPLSMARSTPALQQPLLGRRASTAAELLLDGAMVENQADPEEEYSVKGGVWEQPDDGSREATEVGFGIKFLKHHNSAHKDKLLEYSTQQLESRPWAIILDETRRASVLAMPHVCKRDSNLHPAPSPYGGSADRTRVRI